MPLLPEQLRVLDLSRNSLSGPIPSELNGTELVELDVSYNRISGTVPASLCWLQNLSHLDLSNNNLSGHLPQCRNMSLDGLGLTTLILYKNNLSGEFPVLLKHCHAMTFLDLAQNMIYGILPEWIGRKLSSLTHLRLRSNMFSGNIPTQLAQLGELQLLDLAGNRISGSIPRSLGNMTGMTKEHTLGLNPLTEVRSGEIPKEMSYLNGLVNLNLSRNQLTGTIPQNISDLQKLESLDLAMNELSGAIPPSLSNLTSLDYLNMSYNNLSGRIPSGDQLQVLANPVYIYIGNVGLCGPPLSKKCSSADDANNSRQNLLHQEKDLSKITVAVGFVVGSWLVFCSLLMLKTWRSAYFRTIDKAYDVLNVFVAIRLAKHDKNDS
ncbi:hypothetical protein PR202_ga07174 [Eleusine coracana subsp. coracana]|uniref:Uncharacterized protein n=1 Tax=Eleusine coracana subsp. coracana TaxID=191504 RepID=A0AAV5BWT2_ELECO|nr:hypothetical protein PR202_ga07174 [Eleusine coracana subsp. coracana]